MKLICNPDCGNSPKREMVKQLTQYFAAYDIDKAMQFMATDVVWTLVGDVPIKGKDGFGSALKEMSTNKTKELTIHGVVTHGKEAAVHGELLMEDGNRFGFSDFYEFTSTKSSTVKSIRSYVIPIK